LRVGTECQLSINLQKIHFFDSEENTIY